MGAVFQRVKVRSARAAGGLVLDGALEVWGVKKRGPCPGGQHANSNPWVKGVKWINVLITLAAHG